LEGLVELQRFFSDHDSKSHIPYGSFAFGAYLKSKGASDETISKYTSNPDFIKDGKKVSLFDFTEEKSFDAAADLLLSAKL